MMPDDPSAGRTIRRQLAAKQSGCHIAPTILRWLCPQIAILLMQCGLILAAGVDGSNAIAQSRDPASEFAPWQTPFLMHSALAQNLGTSHRSEEIADPVFPLKASANNRYLVDQNNVPFLMVGDSPQALIANLPVADARIYLANRRRYGINALWVNLLCNWPDICHRDGTTFDGIAPFTDVGDISTPNPEYFKRVDDMLVAAASQGMVILLDPIETSGWMDILRADGPSKAFSYGQFLGSHYKTFRNIVWMHGNDFQSWQDAIDAALVQAVARGIRSADPNHIHTVELNYYTSGSLQDPSWTPLIGLNAAYTYFPTYAQVLTEYNRKDFKPILMVEANYEFEHLPGTDGGSTQNLRRQAYWAMLSGGAGQLYGSAYTWKLQEGWDAKLNTPGVVQLSYMKDLFASKNWYDLVPDQTHTVVTAGYDWLSCLAGKLAAYAGRTPNGYLSKAMSRIRRYSALGSMTTDGCATAARTSDGSLVIAYMPTSRTITIDMSQLAGPTSARWFDPTNGKYADISGSPFANTTKRQFTPPGRNSSGDSDWVLVLSALTRH